MVAGAQTAYAGFYIRRAFRIYPLAWLVIVITVLTHAPVHGSIQNVFAATVHPPNIKAGIASFFLVPNLTRENYLIVGPLWSLAYEVEMYVCLPLLFFFVQRDFTIWPLLAFWTLVIALCHPLFPGVAHNFFLTVPYFLPGIMAYIRFSRARAVIPAWCFPLALAVLWVVFLARPGWRQANWLCLAAGLGLPLFHQLRTPCITRVSHQIAKYSYGIYLMHPFALVLGIHLLPHQPLILQLTVVGTTVTLFSVGAYHLVEHPMVRLGSRVANRVEQRYAQRASAALRIPEAAIE